MAKRQVEMSLANVLSERLKAHLERTGMSVLAFAEKARVSTATLYQILRGKGKTSQMMVARIEDAMKEDIVLTSSEIPPLNPILQDLLEVILEEAVTKKALDRLVQYIFREVDESDQQRVRQIAESFITAFLVRFEGKDQAKELLKLHDLIRGENVTTSQK